MFQFKLITLPYADAVFRRKAARATIPTTNHVGWIASKILARLMLELRSLLPFAEFSDTPTSYHCCSDSVSLRCFAWSPTSILWRQHPKVSRSNSRKSHLAVRWDSLELLFICCCLAKRLASFLFFWAPTCTPPSSANYTTIDLYVLLVDGFCDSLTMLRLSSAWRRGGLLLRDVGQRSLLSNEPNRMQRVMGWKLNMSCCSERIGMTKVILSYLELT